MLGAWLSGRLAGRIKPQHQIRRGFLIMVGASLANVAMNLLGTPHPLLGDAAGVDLLLRLGADGAGGHADGAGPGARAARHGQSSVQAFIGSMANGLVAGVIAPLVMHSTLALALTSLGMMGIGVVAWIWVKPRVT